MHRTVLDTLSEYDAEMARLDAAINNAFTFGLCVGNAVHSFFNTGSPHESGSSIQHCDDGARAGQAGDEPQASGRIQKGWFGDGSGI